jgi:hypothetical protein
MFKIGDDDRLSVRFSEPVALDVKKALAFASAIFRTKLDA